MNKSSLQCWGADPGEPSRPLEVLLLGQRRNLGVCLKAKEKVGIHGPSLPTGTNSELAFPLGLWSVCVPVLSLAISAWPLCSTHHKTTLNLWQSRNKHHNDYWKMDSISWPTCFLGNKRGSSLVTQCSFCAIYNYRSWDLKVLSPVSKEKSKSLEQWSQPS